MVAWLVPTIVLLNAGCGGDANDATQPDDSKQVSTAPRPDVNDAPCELPHEGWLTDGVDTTLPPLIISASAVKDALDSVGAGNLADVGAPILEESQSPSCGVTLYKPGTKVFVGYLSASSSTGGSFQIDEPELTENGYTCMSDRRLGGETGELVVVSCNTEKFNPSLNFKLEQLDFDRSQTVVMNIMRNIIAENGPA